MQYSNYLYFKSIELNESNLYILNEMYFGKTPRIKALEELCQLYIDSFDKKIKKSDLKKFDNIINKGFKKLRSFNHNNRILMNNILFNKKTLSSLDPRDVTDISSEQLKCLSLIEDLISLIFGINAVKIKIDAYASGLNFSIYHSLYENIKVQNNTILFKDNDENYLDLDYIKKNIIVKNTGISLNMEKCKFSIVLFFPVTLSYKHITGKNLTAILLHEIGHFFSYLLMPINKYTLMNAHPYLSDNDSLVINGDYLGNDNYKSSKEKDKWIKIVKDNQDLFNISDDELKKLKFANNKAKKDVLIRIAQRMNEKFADNFAALYGYSIEFLHGFKIYNPNIYKYLYDSEETNKKLHNFNTKLNTSNNNFSSLEFLAKSSNIDNIDEHPLLIHRMESQIEQLESEKNNPRISISKRKEIEHILQELKIKLHNIKFTNLDRKFNDPRTDKEIIEIIKNRYYEEHISPIDRLINGKKDFEQSQKEELQELKDQLNHYNKLLATGPEGAKEFARSQIPEIEEEIESKEGICHNVLKAIKNDEQRKKQAIQDMNNYLNNKIELNKQIQIEREKFYLEFIKNYPAYFKDVKDSKRKGTKNYRYEKDSHIDPYDISTEINKLYDNTKLRHINTIFNNDTWLNIKAQKLFENILNRCIKDNRVSSDDIMTFIEEKYKYHMEKPFFKNKKIQEEIIKIFAQEQRIIENKLNEFIKNKFNLSNELQLNMLLKVIEEDNLNKNIKKLKRALFGRKNNN